MVRASGQRGSAALARSLPDIPGAAILRGMLRLAMLAGTLAALALIASAVAWWRVSNQPDSSPSLRRAASFSAVAFALLSITLGAAVWSGATP